MKSIAVSRSLVEGLEPRVLLSGNDPSAREQYMLELINRARQNPTAELPLLLDPAHADVQSAMSYFRVSTSKLRQQWAYLQPVPPLAWNGELATAADGHNAFMLEHDKQSHQLPGEGDLGQRVDAVGYNYSVVGENVYSAAERVFHAHAAFLIDWGEDSGGIQDPPGHREHIYAPQAKDADGRSVSDSPVFREVGLSIIDSTAGKQSGPLLVTQNFGNRFGFRDPFLLGVVYADTVQADAFYTPGEGAADVTITATRQADLAQFSATTMTSGGYQLQLPAGAYEVRASGGGLTTDLVKTVTVASDNVKADFVVGEGSSGGGDEEPMDRPDLVAQVKKAPSSIKAGQAIRGTLRVSNTGAAASGGQATIGLFFSTDAVLDEGDLALGSVGFAADLAVGKSRNVSFNVSSPVTLSLGNYYLLAKVDSGSAVAESDEANNVASARRPTRFAPPTTNLAASFSGKVKGPVKPGATVPMALRIRNLGSVVADGEFSLTLSLQSPDGLVTELVTLPDAGLRIKAGGSMTLKTTLTMPTELLSGSGYRFVASITSALSLPETSVGDNRAASAFFAVA